MRNWIKGVSIRKVENHLSERSNGPRKVLKPDPGR